MFSLMTCNVLLLKASTAYHDAALTVETEIGKGTTGVYEPLFDVAKLTTSAKHNKAPVSNLSYGSLHTAYVTDSVRALASHHPKTAGREQKMDGSTHE